MLSIFFGDMPEAIYNPVVYFKNTYTDDWITDPLSKDMIRAVDRSEVVGPRVIDSPVLGGISPLGLSGGVKTLIAMYKAPHKIFNASVCGDNCARLFDSATGKTTLVEMIREYYDSGEDSGIQLHCERPCRVLAGRDWKLVLDTVHEEIIFIDENNGFLLTDEFAKAVQESDNYYVIVTREGLPNLPYSVEEIYGIRESGKYGTLKQTYNELYHIYGKRDYIYDTRQLSKIYEAQDK